VVRFPRVDGIVPELQAAQTGTGAHTVKHRTQTERNQLYLAAITAQSIAVTREAFAAAPGLSSATVLVIEGHAPDDPVPQVSPLLAVRFQKTALEAMNMDEMWATQVAYSFEHVLNIRGRTADVAPISLAKNPDLRPAVEKISQDLKWPVDPRCN
jgi:hypothetical protein